jgi:GntR family transcriptional regulator / MocR family aminotransferase
MQSGAYDRHLRASRLRYRTRRDALLDALQRRLSEYRVVGAESGLLVLLELPPGANAAAIMAAAARRGLLVGSLDEFCSPPDPARQGLLLGYGNVKDSALDEAVAVLADVIRQVA